MKEIETKVKQRYDLNIPQTNRKLNTWLDSRFKKHIEIYKIIFYNLYDLKEEGTGIIKSPYANIHQQIVGASMANIGHLTGSKLTKAFNDCNISFIEYSIMLKEIGETYCTFSYKSTGTQTRHYWVMKDEVMEEIQKTEGTRICSNPECREKLPLISANFYRKGDIYRTRCKHCYNNPKKGIVVKKPVNVPESVPKPDVTIVSNEMPVDFTGEDIFDMGYNDNKRAIEFDEIDSNVDIMDMT